MSLVKWIQNVFHVHQWRLLDGIPIVTPDGIARSMVMCRLCKKCGKRQRTIAGWSTWVDDKEADNETDK